MPTIFSRIISGEIPSYKVYEDDDFFAFLDINPVAFGHTLVVPKLEVDYLFELEDDKYSDLMLCSKKIAKVLKEIVPCMKIGMSVIGLEVPHVHVHLIPIHKVSDMDFSKRVTVSEKDMIDLATAIHARLI